MKKVSKFLILLTTVHLPLITFLFIGCQENHANQVCFDKHCFKVEIVSSGEAMQRGLQFRKSLDRDAGMLFIFPDEQKHAFWMKDTLIPLDMIWLNYGHQVVYLKQNVPPCESDPCPVYTPSQKALFVLEINAGAAERNKIKVGDAAEFKININSLNVNGN